MLSFKILLMFTPFRPKYKFNRSKRWTVFKYWIRSDPRSLKVLEVGAIVREEYFGTTESEENLPTQFAYHGLCVSFTYRRSLRPPGEKVLKYDDVFKAFRCARKRPDNVSSHDLPVVPHKIADMFRSCASRRCSSGTSMHPRLRRRLTLPSG